MTERNISTLEAVYSHMADIPGLPDAYQPRNIAAALKVMRASPAAQAHADAAHWANCPLGKLAGVAG